MPLASDDLPEWFAAGCATDWIEREYDVGMRLWRDRPDIIVMGHYYMCPPGSYPVPYLHPWLASENQYGGTYLPTELGEVPSTIRYLVRPLNPRFIGLTPLGGADVWLNSSLHTGRPYWTVDIDGIPLAASVRPTVPGGAAAGGAGEWGTPWPHGASAGGAGVFLRCGTGGAAANGRGRFVAVGKGGVAAGGVGTFLPEHYGWEAASGRGVFLSRASGGCGAGGTGRFLHVATGGASVGGRGTFVEEDRGGAAAGGNGLLMLLGSGGAGAAGSGLFLDIDQGGAGAGGAGLTALIGSGGATGGGTGLWAWMGSGGAGAGGVGVWSTLYMGTASARYDFDRNEAPGSAGAGVCFSTFGINGGSTSIAKGIAGTYMVAQMLTGASSTGEGAILQSDNSISLIYSLQSNTSNAVEFRLYIPTLSTGTDRFKVMVGFMDNIGGTPSEGVWLEYIDNVNAGKWTLNTKKTSGGAGSTSSNSTVAPVAGTITTVSVKVTGTSAEFFADGVSLGTVATNVPSGATGVGALILKSVGNNSRELSVDYVMPTITF